MTANEIVRSWKDEDYRLSLNSEELALMPGNPAGLIELTDQELVGVEGAETILACTPAISAVTSPFLSVASILATVAISVVSYFHCGN